MEVPFTTKTFLCPHCNVVSLHQQLGDGLHYTQRLVLKGKDGRNYQKDAPMSHEIYRCVNCSKDTYLLIRGEVQIWGAGPTSLAHLPSETVHQYPISTPSLHSAVRIDVRRATIEAENCFSVRAFNACGVMARRAIHCICIDKGARGKDLYEQLKYLKENNLITPDIWEWAEELRILGRSGAHPEWEEVSQEEADYALRFLREIIRYVYINPAERVAKRLKETKKKKP